MGISSLSRLSSRLLAAACSIFAGLEFGSPGKKRTESSHVPGVGPRLARVPIVRLGPAPAELSYPAEPPVGPCVGSRPWVPSGRVFSYRRVSAFEVPGASPAAPRRQRRPGQPDLGVLWACSARLEQRWPRDPMRPAFGTSLALRSCYAEQAPGGITAGQHRCTQDEFSNTEKYSDI
ncbi:hypothetical protein TREES_T100010771 [Tupaia chinensis]|uniref:Secreted protein n=1 Tax=Tupaia chinensis TaxID=246437 RepID=L9KK96_TUPCH|nr:hypothetical protein TREES_T100010771 [Tupaia chinensis]